MNSHIYTYVPYPAVTAYHCQQPYVSIGRVLHCTIKELMSMTGSDKVPIHSHCVPLSITVCLCRPRVIKELTYPYLCSIRSSHCVPLSITVCDGRPRAIKELTYPYLSGLEINNLRQWTTGPPSLRIWWSGLKSGGPENYSVIRAYTIHFHLKFITECVQ